MLPDFRTVEYDNGCSIANFEWRVHNRAPSRSKNSVLLKKCDAGVQNDRYRLLTYLYHDGT
jgi:hypothetical protein